VLSADAAATRAFVRSAIQARRSHVALRRGEARVAATGPRWIALERTADGRRAIVAVNAGDDEAAIDLEGAAGGLTPIELSGLVGTTDGALLTLPPLGGIVLVEG
jgi:glycosidase